MHWNTLAGYYPAQAEYISPSPKRPLTREDKKYLQTNLIPYLDTIQPIQQTNHCCYPLRAPSPSSLNWKTTILNEYLDEQSSKKSKHNKSRIKEKKPLRRKYEAISVVPTYNLLKDTHFMHKCNPLFPFQKWDCTHYCYFPTMFQAMWVTFETIIRTGCVGRECQIFGSEK